MGDEQEGERMTTADFVTGAEPVSSTTLHAQTRQTLAKVREGRCLAVTHYNALQGYLVPPEHYNSLSEQAQALQVREQELRDTLLLIMAAVRTGVAIPSDTLDRLSFGLDDSWCSIAEFAAAFPVRISRGEDGTPIARGRLRGHEGPIAEYGDDDDLNLDV